MAARSYRGPRRVLAVAVLIGAVAVVAGSSATGTTGPPTLRVLQMNLCNSGQAGCYTGRSVAQAGEVIRAEAPDLVTLNEVCRDDVSRLERALTEVRPGGTVVSAFAAARHGRTGEPYRCRNGQQYGIGLLASVPAPYRGHTVHSGIYPMQDPVDPEHRAWLCVDAVGAFHACTTHLAYTSAFLALDQCTHLLRTAIPALHRQAGYRPTVLSGDLNLRPGGAPDVRACLPPGYLRVGDGAVQQVVATTDLAIGPRRSIDMAGTTDHASFLVTLTITGKTDGPL
ncbi:endonuclease/exonuclease/phosphatase family protein [Micromonospora sp. NPDC126480]|uniref:endonuclease/exonuclease/phosphatase family protein n=1 Tax=Micromonospora sp. NPDC126480 TaxID=3155312 RepID=UPI003332FFB3